MKPSNKAEMVFKAVCSSILLIGILVGLSGTAAAQRTQTFTDFCDPTVYDNVHVDNTVSPPAQQTFGKFTDVSRKVLPFGSTYIYMPDSIMRTDALSTTPCRLRFCWAETGCPVVYGNGISSNQVFYTLIGGPGAPPAMDRCWNLTATVTTSNLNNRKGIGFVTNYDPSTMTGLVFAMYRGGPYGNPEGDLMLHSFAAKASCAPCTVADGASEMASTYSGGTNWLAGSNNNISGSVATGTGVGINIQAVPAAYRLRLDICSTDTRLQATGSWQPANSANPAGTCLPNGTGRVDKASDQVCITYDGALPAGISGIGAAGLIGVFDGGGGGGKIDATVYTFQGIGNLNPD